MKGLKERASAEEAYYVNRQRAEFLARASGLRRLGEWAASQMMGEGAPGVAAYAEALVRSGVAGTDAFTAVTDDLRLAGRDSASSEVQSQFDKFLAEARLKAAS